MRYIIVSERVPKGLKRFCALCTTEIVAGYTRDLTTSVVYCTPLCCESHIYASLVANGLLDAPMPRLLTWRAS